MEVSSRDQAGKVLPSVSILLPVAPEWPGKNQTQSELKSMVNEAAKELHDTFPAENVTKVIDRLNDLISLIDWEHPPRGIALYVSPDVEKYYPVSVPVTKKLIIDTSFEIRDLLYAIKSTQHLAVLVISHQGLRILYGNEQQLEDINEDEQQPSPFHAGLSALLRDLITEKQNSQNFERFLHNVYDSIKKFAAEHSLRVFIMAPVEVLSYFLQFPDHEKYLDGTVHGNYDALARGEILGKLKDEFSKWNLKHNDDLINQLHEADRKNMLAIGIVDVWNEAANTKGHLLVVEKDYRVQAVKGPNDLTIRKPDKDTPASLIMKDAVDDVIEMVLRYGGDVSFVENGKLIEFEHIALIKRF